jgi:hypothetical protein|nr:MAG TPA: hypothetical protein [Caudoviricetes sp.]
MSEVKKRTAVSFAIECSKYIPGYGYQTVLETIKTIVGYDEEKNSLYSDIFYVSWQERIGNNSIIQQQNNIVQTATLQMTYVKEVADALYTKNVKVYKNCNRNESYVLNSSVINNFNQTLEFQIKRVEVK